MLVVHKRGENISCQFLGFFRSGEGGRRGWTICIIPILRNWEKGGRVKVLRGRGLFWFGDYHVARHAVVRKREGRGGRWEGGGIDIVMLAEIRVPVDMLERREDGARSRGEYLIPNHFNKTTNNTNNNTTKGGEGIW